MDGNRFSMLPGMNEETFYAWCKSKDLSETDLTFILRSVKLNVNYIPNRKITVDDVADKLGFCAQAVRIMLQKGMLPFGFADKLTNGQYSYIIFPEKFREYCGELERRES